MICSKASCGREKRLRTIFSEGYCTVIQINDTLRCALHFALAVLSVILVIIYFLTSLSFHTYPIDYACASTTTRILIQ